MKKFYLFYKELLTTNWKWIKRIAQWGALWFVLGAVFAFVKPELGEKFLAFIMKVLEEVVTTKDFISFQTVLLIFKQNVQASLIVLFLGIILGLVPLLSTAFNFFILGFLLAYFFSKSVIAGFIVLLILLPHGIIEIPALLIADAFGFRLGWFWKIKDPNLTIGKKFKLALKQNFQLVPLLVTLLVVAAILEVFVSGALGAWFESIVTPLK